MTKRLTTEEIMRIYYAADEFVKKDIKLPARFAWDLEDNMDTMKAIIAKFEKIREKEIAPLRDKGAFEQVKGQENQISIKEEFRDEFIESNKKVEEFVKLEHEVEIATVPRSLVPDKISNKDLRAIKFMIVKDEAENTETNK